MKYFTQTLFINLLTAIMLLSPSILYAAGGFGGVSATATDSTLSVSWNWNVNNYRAAIGHNPIKICYKKSSIIKNACNNKTQFTSAAPRTLVNLEDDNKYKIKVFCYCEKRNWRGRWRNPKWRKIGTLTQSTLPSSIDPNQFSGTLSIIGSFVDAGNTNGAAASIQTSFLAGNIQGVDMIRICYRRTTALNALKSRCKNRNISWNGSGNRLGWIDQTPMSFDNTFGKLRAGRQYKFVAVVFAQGGGGKVVDTAKAHTPRIR